MENESSCWGIKNSLDFYKTTRNKRKDVYPSEDFFLRKIITPQTTLLDVGCAAGGFYNILKSYEPNINYTGTDACKPMINAAEVLHPSLRFEVCKEDKLPFKNNKFGIVMAFGVLPMTTKWKAMLKECFRVCNAGILFDIRMGKNTICNPKKSFQRIMFDGKWDGKTKCPYVLISPNDLFAEIEKLKPQDVEIYAYRHKVSSMAKTPEKEVWMATLYLKRK
jgi:ubiquinone/menaquinone biosynthesis C-methylase UbiE